MTQVVETSHLSGVRVEVSARRYGEQRELGAYVAASCGDDAARWEMFESLFADWSGTFGELCGTVASLSTPQPFGPWERIPAALRKTIPAALRSIGEFYLRATEPQRSADDLDPNLVRATWRFACQHRQHDLLRQLLAGNSPLPRDVDELVKATRSGDVRGWWLGRAERTAADADLWPTDTSKVLEVARAALRNRTGETGHPRIAEILRRAAGAGSEVRVWGPSFESCGVPHLTADGSRVVVGSWEGALHGLRGIDALDGSGTAALPGKRLAKQVRSRITDQLLRLASDGALDPEMRLAVAEMVSAMRAHDHRR